MDKKLAQKDLEAVRKVFKKLNLPLFLMYGTALGAYRDNDFLDGDRDIDIGTWGEDKKELIWKELEPLGFYKREGHGYLAGKTDFRSLHVNRNVPFDLFLFEEYKGLDDYLAYTDEDIICAELPKKFSKLEKINFKGKEYLIPSPTDAFLEHYYGDWNSRIKKSGR